LHFIENLAWLDLSHPVGNVTLTLTLTNFKGLFGNGFVWKNTDPDLAATLDVTAHGTTGSLNLTGSQSTTICGLESVFAKAYFATAKRETAVAAFHLLTEFGSFRLQHVARPLFANHFLGLDWSASGAPSISPLKIQTFTPIIP